MLCDDPCTDCEDTGITVQTERYCSCQAGIALRDSDPDLMREDRDERRRMELEMPYDE